MILWAEGIFSILLSVAAFVRCPRLTRIPFLTYYMGYLVTTVIGALTIYFTQDNPIFQSIIFFTVDLGTLPAKLPDYYIHLLLLPFLVVSTTLLLLFSIFPERDTPKLLTPNSAFDHSNAIMALLAACIFFGIYCVIRVGLFPFAMFAGSGSYANAIVLRYATVAALGNSYMSVVTVVIPTLAVALLALYLRDGKRWQLISLMIAIVFDFYFESATFSKGGFVSMVLYLAAGWSAMRRLRVMLILAIGLSSLVFLTAATAWQSSIALDAQGMLLAALTASKDIFFRLALAFPFYALLFPDVLPRPGPDIGLAFFNIQPSYSISTAVYNYMYPGVAFAQGSVTAPSHVLSYAEWGWGFAVVTLILTGVLIFWLGRIGARIKSSMGLATFAATCIGIYFTTQGGFYSSFQYYYGCLWAWVTFGAYHLLVQFDRITSRTSP